jgi:phosphoserine phosphatase
MDSTMIGQECIDELADFAGIKDQIAAITERAMQGELDFAEALTERVRLLGGLGEDAIQQCLDQRIRDAGRAGAGRDAKSAWLPHRAGHRRLSPVRRSGGRTAGV